MAKSGPIAHNDTISLITADTSVMSFIIPASQVLANDTVKPGNGNAVHITSAQGVSGASVQITPSGDLQVIPTDPYHPSDSFKYTITDGHGLSSTALVTVDYTVANSPPVISGPGSDSVASDGNSFLLIPASDILANVSDPDGDVVSLVGVGVITGGGGTQSDFQPSVSLFQKFGNTFVDIDNVRGTPILSGNFVAFNYVVADSAGLSATSNFTVNIT